MEGRAKAHIGVYMKLKDGMYIMSNDRLQIGIVKFIENSIPTVVVNDKVQWLQFCGIFWNRKSASFNIIDLIAVGDYVNGYKVVNILSNKVNGNKILVCGLEVECCSIDEFVKCEKVDFITKEQIKTVVTKEKFASIEYKVASK